ncbi:MAG: DUF5110 domain-containing protein [Clostridia bacterium]|nr:DUF5110 domain-containing protein [Clostridia bacterium]
MKNVFLFEAQGRRVELRAIDEGIFRVRLSATGKFRESMLSRYGILQEQPKDIEARLEDGVLQTGRFSLALSGESLSVSGEGHSLAFTVSGRGGEALSEEGFRLSLGLTEKERLYGLGDENRDGIMKRGRVATLWQTDYIGYGPIPFLMSSAGWGILVNCTYLHTYDMGASEKNTLVIDAEKGALDFYIFLASDMKGVLQLYTDVSGKPVMLPKSAYGFTFVCNEQANAKMMLEDCAAFRRYGIPCDIVGLEPGWMETHYDFSVDKKWDAERFYLPYWEPANYTGIFSFCYNLRKMGYKLSLWLCCDYDLLYEEEGEVRRRTENSMEGRLIKDEHLHYSVSMDRITKQGEPWFEHLKKFVDNGAAAFKLDASQQCLEHPDRLWAGKYFDDEVHNVYCVIYAKQMKEGFQNYTGKRALIYTPCLYAGTQRYAASWAGDTGGGEGTLTSILNLALSGHANASCDLDPTDPKSIHYGFLMPWSQLLGWRNWHQPWLLGEELEEMIRSYSRLRSSLFPYIYSMAHLTNRTGIPLARPLCLAYPDAPALDALRNEYMLGDSLLVGAFDMHLTLPKGKWTDFFTGKEYEGERELDYLPPKGKGGALFVKEGSILVMQEPMSHVDAGFPEEYLVHIYPGADTAFTLVEDDGITYDYEDGKVFETKMEMTDSCKEGFTFTLYTREGEWGEKKTEEAYDVNTMSENHIANVPDAPAVSGFTVMIHGDYIVEGAEATSENGTTVLRISKEAHEAGVLSFRAVKK